MTKQPSRTRERSHRKLAAIAACALALSLWAAGGETKAATAIGPPPGDLSPQDDEHPLEPLIRWGHAATKSLDALEDYSCLLVKRERIGGRLRPHEYIELKVRHRPFSVYARFLGRGRKTRQETIFIEGANNGQMWAHSKRFDFLGTVSLYPNSRRALEENRYPITEVGIMNLIRRLVEHAERDVEYGECEVKVYEGATIESRPCLCVTVTHPKRRRQFRFHHARIYLDSELNIPVRYESYHWPRSEGKPPQLIEEYTYLQFSFNQGLNSADFDIRNPAYGFPARETGSLAAVEGIAPVGKDTEKQAWQTFKPVGDGHPLRPVLQLVEGAARELAAIDTYTCVFTIRERIEDKLSEPTHSFVKVRHQPFSLYMLGLGPQRVSGREAVYVEGQHLGQVLVHEAPHQRRLLTGSMWFAPDSPLLARLSRHPITQMGLKSLLDKTIAMWSDEVRYGECDVRFLAGTRLGDTPSTCIEVVHPKPRSNFKYHIVRLYLDDELRVPRRFESYGWPTTEGAAPVLLEEYTFRDLLLGAELTDADFDEHNPDYGFHPATEAQRNTEAASRTTVAD